MDRRSFLGLTAAVGAAAVVGCSTRTPAPPPIAPRPLVVPPLARAATDRSGRRVLDLVAGAGTSSFLAGRATPTWGYGGLPFGGPTLRATRGDRVVVRVRNDLPETTTTHWHGMTLPATADGGPHQPIAPGETWTPEWTVEQPAATLWYHPHPHGSTERHVHRGLAGLFLVDDPEPTGLPDRYGVDDVPVVVTDRTFAPDGSFDEAGRTAHGLVGSTVLVNGAVRPYLAASSTRLRLRLLNASPARCYRVARSDGAPLVLVGTDQGLLPAPRDAADVLLTPGERAEVVVDLVPGARVWLRSLPQDLGAVSGTERSLGARDTLDLLELRAPADAAPPPPLPTTLPHDPALVLPAGATTRVLELGDDRINGREMDMRRVDEVVPAGAVELWELRNTHTRPHNLHVHDARGQVLGTHAWKDTVYVPPRSTVRVVFRFGRHADPVTPFMYHCHLLAHEDQGMMGQFVVVDPGMSAGPVTGAHHHG
ncbi:multicopper oxidase domain-containing protein [Actinomycetospora sp. OC33-EN08]|uniref:Multicopper oxidase CueO n=1 Tax=Actinomycetospora aurantiaca TaxID=3129233 RepID=A0ABU8MK81_9PSEU